MAYNWDYTKKWLIKIDDVLYKIVYEGNLETQKYYVTINDIKEEIFIKEDLRGKKYDKFPYEQKFDIDGLDAVFYINEENVSLIVEGYDVDLLIKYIPAKKLNKMVYIGSFCGLIMASLTLMLIIPGRFWEYGYLIQIFIALTIIIIRLDMYRASKKVKSIVDKRGRIVKLDVSKEFLSKIRYDF